MKYIQLPPYQQLDLFVDTQASQLHNLMLDYLIDHNTQAALHLLDQLKAELPEDPMLPALHTLLEGLTHSWPAIHEGFHYGQSVLQPLAEQWFKSESARWMAAYWKKLATQAMTTMTASTELPLNELHPAALFLKAGDYQTARDTISALPCWWQQCPTLDWMLSSLLQENSLDSAWSLLFELAWLYPETCVARIESCKISRLQSAHSQFEMNLPAESMQDTVWFPAWMLLQEPALCSLVKTARYPEQENWGKAFETVMNMQIHHRDNPHYRQDHYRRLLQQWHPGLLQASLHH